MSAAQQRPKIGDPVLRREDERLITGAGQFSDDFNLAGQAQGFMLRSPHAHAEIQGIDVSRALQTRGIIEILTAKEMLADGINPAPHKPRLLSKPDIEMTSLLPGTDAITTPYYPLPVDRVRYFGEGVAFVIAESLEVAQAAAELIDVRYKPLPAVTQARDAQDAANIWQEAPHNLIADAIAGDEAEVSQIFADAAHVVTLDTLVQRVTGVPMEPRACVAEYDQRSKRYTLHAGSGGVHRQRMELARMLGVPETDVRVLARDIGGNFGTRNAIYPEFALCAWAAKRTGRPVKWTCERSEALATDYGGRDLTAHAELALNAKGNFLAFRADNLGNLGAHTVGMISLIKASSIMTSIYKIPTAHVRARAVLTNTVPTTSYRGAGRPEAMFVIERLIDLAARRHGFDRIKLRRRNLIASGGAFHTNPLGLVYDGGNYEAAMDRALEMGAWPGFAARRKEALKRGKRRGIGFSNYVEITTGVLRERTEIIVRPDGFVDYTVGTLSSGQGHETSFPQLLTDWLGVPMESIRFGQGDTDAAEFGGGTQSGRSMRMIAIVAEKATQEILKKARSIAAHVLKASEDALAFEDGAFHAGIDPRRLDLFEIARAAIERNDLPDDLRGELRGLCDETIDTAGFPYGAHVCEVEVDPETGAYEIIRYSAVDDVGTCVNPMIMHGQSHGAIAQGLGQAMCEECTYDTASGQLLAGSFMDYALPKADMVPSFNVHISEFPSPTNGVGVRSGGEGGTVPALAVLVNALVDALQEYGVEHIEMPATPQRVWRAIMAASSKNSGNIREDKQ